MHRDLKTLYAGDGARTEVRVGRYRIDAMAGEELIEIQHGRLSALTPKLRELLAEHRVRVVKPIVREKLLLSRNRKGGKVVRQRRSPKRGSLLDMFDELVYFVRTFPHPRLSIEAVLVDVEEDRYPGHGRRRRYRKNDFVIEDQRLVAVHENFLLQSPQDLVRLMGCELPARFSTGDIARGLDRPRWLAQRVAYCLRETGAAVTVGKQRNAILYELAKPKRRRRRDAA
ncbi:MAG TPA: hypothetical protein VGJ26_20735 [Pirellulales bacterium]